MAYVRILQFVSVLYGLKDRTPVLAKLLILELQDLHELHDLHRLHAATQRARWSPSPEGLRDSKHLPPKGAVSSSLCYSPPTERRKNHLITVSSSLSQSNG